MADMDYCDGSTDGGRMGLMRCSRRGTVEHSGKKYCWQHDPLRVKEERTKRRLKYEAERSEWEAKNAQSRERDEYRNLCVSVIESAAIQLQRDCPDCKGSGQHITLKPSTGVRSAPSLTPPSPCSTCKGSTKLGITALELAEKLQDGALAEILRQVNRGNAKPIWVKELFDKLQPKEAR